MLLLLVIFPVDIDMEITAEMPSEDEINDEDYSSDPIDAFLDDVNDFDSDDASSEDVFEDANNGGSDFLLNALHAWVAEHNIAEHNISSLMAILRHAYKDEKLPKDPRTVMKTPRHIETTKLNDGSEYWHQGLEKCLRLHFEGMTVDKTISLNMNIDGLPLFNSATKCFWPILANVYECPDLPPMAVGIFYGEKKPENAEIYFRPFVEECKNVLQNGLLINGRQLTVNIRCFICDSPARAFVKGNF